MVQAPGRPGAATVRTPRRRTVDTGRQEELLTKVAAVFFSEGFTAVGVDELSHRLKCSKATLYAIAGSKEQLVLKITKRFFAASTERIEEVVTAELDPGRQIQAYLDGVGQAMGSMSPRFYEDMVSYPPTAEVYSANAAAAADRVQQIIAAGLDQGHFRSVHGVFAGQLVAWAIEGIHSGELLRDTGMTAGGAFSELGDLILHGLQSLTAR